MRNNKIKKPLTGKKDNPGEIKKEETKKVKAEKSKENPKNNLKESKVNLSKSDIKKKEIRNPEKKTTYSSARPRINTKTKNDKSASKTLDEQEIKQNLTIDAQPKTTEEVIPKPIDEVVPKPIEEVIPKPVDEVVPQQVLEPSIDVKDILPKEEAPIAVTTNEV